MFLFYLKLATIHVYLEESSYLSHQLNTDFEPLRQIKTGKEDVYVGTADFISSEKSRDHMGMFCCSVFGSVTMANKFEETGDDFNSLMVKALADRLVITFMFYTNLICL